MNNPTLQFSAVTQDGLLIGGSFPSLAPWQVSYAGPIACPVGSPVSEGYWLNPLTDALWLRQSDPDGVGGMPGTPGASDASWSQIGPLGVDLQPVNGWLVQDGAGWLVNPAGEGSTIPQLYRVDLQTGHAAYIGEVGLDMAMTVNGLAAVPEPSPLALVLCALAAFLWMKLRQ